MNEIKKYEAGAGFLFDWREPRFTQDEYGAPVQEHLFAQTLFLSANDAIDNYILVEA